MLETLDLVAQFAIPLFGIAAIFLVARKNKWGFILGLAVQPFWFITSYQNEQWGVFVSSIAYTVSWGFGIYNWFRKPEKKVS